MRTVTVDLPGRCYDILIGSGLSDRLPHYLGRPGRAVIVADRTVAPIARRIAGALDAARWRTDILEVTAAEPLKSFAGIGQIYDGLLELGADRHTTIVSVGGGTVGDAVGFVAGTFVRGVRHVAVATTLLAQVDSAIGGKTGINHARAKNMIGLVVQPSLVVCDLDALATLDRRDRISGLGEMVKYGLIADPDLYRQLIADWENLLEDAGALEDLIARCAAIKARLVVQDEFDRKGPREILNFGHTVGHALEQVTGYGHFRHGEAILLGLRAALDLSQRRGHLDPAVAQRTGEELAAIPVPALPALARADLFAAMAKDKKRSETGATRFVLIDRIGHTVADAGVTPEEIGQALEVIAL